MILDHAAQLLIRQQIGGCHRLDLAEARVRALQGADADEVRNLVKKSMASAPTDVVSEFERRQGYAQIYAIAGMAPDAIEMLEPLFQPPSVTSVYKVDLDPAFDAIRDEGIPVHLIGGADVAAELDAKRAILQGAELAARI